MLREKRRLSCRSFTMLEVLVVTLLVGMLFAVILPRVSVAPKRIVVENALSGIRQAFSETGARARANGRAFRLTLDPDSSTLAVSPLPDTLSREWQPPLPVVEDKAKKPSFLAIKDSYELSGDLEWQLDQQVYDHEGKIIFSFFPDGQAGGPNLEFSIKKRRFVLRVDNVTGRPDIVEVE
jgi:type II secretory pathway pseudopilin PulG